MPVKLPLVPHDLIGGTWARVRAGLVAALWESRMILERPDLTDVENISIRERIKLVKELLSIDPKKEDYDLRARSAANLVPEVLAAAFPAMPPEETVPDDKPGATGPGRDHDD